MNRIARGTAAVAIAVATAIVIVAASVVPFLSPAWVSFEQDRAEAAAWTGYTPDDLRVATDAILADLVVGPPAFDVTVAGEPVLNAREQAHMRDVRAVFGAFGGLALVALGVLAIAALVGRRRRTAGPTWTAVARGAGTLAIAVVAAGGAALVAFDTLFELFHRLFFAGGSYTFDPRTERLVQLFPFRFWQETAIAVGAVIVVVAAAVWAIARRRAQAAVGSAASPVAVSVGQGAR
jgi:integral membrane protein (TIGR01906 family)